MACAPRAYCLTTGTYLARNDATRTLAETWNGTSMRLASPPGLAGVLAPVSCPAASFCLAANGASAAIWNGTHLHGPHPRFLEVSLGDGLASTLRPGVVSTAGRPGASVEWRVGGSGPGSREAVVAVRLWRARFRAVGVSVALIGALAGGGLTAGQAVGGTRSARAASPDSLAMPGHFLGAVSCLGSSFCMGVGPDVDATVYTAPYSQVWDGARWRTIPVPNRNPHLDGLFGISCTSAKNCVAVGGEGPQRENELSDVWNGRSWKMLLPPPGAKDVSVLNGVDCTGAKACIAVGEGPNFALAQTWNGSSWRLMPRPVVPPGTFGGGISEFRGIACTGPSRCLAVGDYFPRKLTSHRHALAESWNGHSWKRLRGLPTYFTQLNGVACPSVKVCVAVGEGEQGKDVDAVSARWNGSSWTGLTTPSPGGNDSGQTLTSVSCPSVTYCIATSSGPGMFGSGNGTGAFAEKWTGGPAWTLLSVPDPPTFTFDGTMEAPDSLAGVSCPSRTRCMAVGGDEDTSNSAISSYSSFAVSWNGASWRVLRTSKVDVLRGVACAPRAYCLTTGTYLARNDATRTLAETWNGTSMRLASPPGLAGVLAPVSCPAASFCLAANGASAAIWNGTQWTSPGVSDTAVRTGIISWLSCVSRDFCMAMGFADGADLFSEFWDGKTWHSAKIVAPKRSSIEFAPVGALSCATPKMCLAVGALEAGDGGPVGTFAEAWNGSKWRVLRSPFQHNPSDALTAVSCRTATDCVTTGADQGGTTSTLFTSRWNGQHWTVTKLPGTYRYTVWYYGGPSSLSCPTATSCVAVGGKSKNTDLALIWNGHSWRVTKAGSPGGILEVSCASARQCVATGQPRTTTTLAKLWNGGTWKSIKTINP